MVVGGAGAGKSTLAREIGGRRGLPVTHCDALFWQPGWVEGDREVLHARLREIAATDAWVIDGNYSASWPDRLARADTVVFLDIATALRLWRVLRRSVANYGRTRPDLAPDCPEQLPDRDFLGWIVGYRRRGRPKALALLKESRRLGLATHCLRSRRAVATFLETL